jgi:hypothetical protein
LSSVADFRLNSGGAPADAVATYGQKVVDRIHFDRGRIYPSFQVNASAGADIYKSELMKIRLQVDGENLTKVIDFGGFFFANAIRPSRSFSLRLSTSF